MTSPFSSWKNLRRTPYQSLMALVVVITTFFMVFCFTTILYISNQVLFYFETRPQILVFFETSVTDAEATEAANLIAQLDYVDEVKITGKTDAYESYQKENQDDPLLLSLLTPDMFPVSLSISANDPEALSKIRTEIDKLEGVDEVDYQKDVVEEFLSWTKTLRNIAINVSALFVIQFVLVILVITGMKVVNRRQTIGVMQLLGASRTSIRWMFVREAMWLGIIGGLLAFACAYSLLYYLQPQLQQFFGGVAVLPLPWQFFAIQLGGGVAAAAILAGLSAWLAATKLIRK
ncbi:ABC transporter permease [bacterium]|nr:ABC transporter permease [bacterium]